MPEKMNHRTRLTLLAACLALVISLLDTSVENVAIDAIRLNLHALQWIINAYSVAFATLLLTAGIMGDRFGSKPIFLTGFVLFTAGSLCCGLSSTLMTLIASRVVQGIGAALLVPTSLSIIRELFDDDVLQGRAVSWWGAGGGIAVAACPVVGDILVSSAGWPSIFC